MRLHRSCVCLLHASTLGLNAQCRTCNPPCCFILWINRALASIPASRGIHQKFSVQSTVAHFNQPVRKCATLKHANQVQASASALTHCRSYATGPNTMQTVRLSEFSLKAQKQCINSGEVSGNSEETRSKTNWPPSVFALRTMILPPHKGLQCPKITSFGIVWSASTKHLSLYLGSDSQ